MLCEAANIWKTTSRWATSRVERAALADDVAVRSTRCTRYATARARRGAAPLS
ncbi:hypothetical protein [Sorangium sp. So ce1335]|uniref:hypothetical protein n=1 Tax=Sorangium sp. So ce1335 TaxID=3133335 RepID=UPI003F60C19E